MNREQLSQIMEDLQTQSEKNSELNYDFDEALQACREECSKKLQKLFKKDFDSLMNDPVEILPLNLKAKVDPMQEETENHEHKAKIQELKSQIQQYQTDIEKLCEKRDRMVAFASANFL